MKINTNVESLEKEKQNPKKKKPNRNGEVGINKKNNYAYVRNAPRKICMNCGSSNHLTHMCKKPKNKDKNEFNLGHQIPLLEKAYPFCDNFDCMRCKMNVITSCFNMKTKFFKGCISKKEKPRTASAVKVERTSVSPKSSEPSHKTSKGAHKITKIPDAYKSYSSHAYIDKLQLLNIMDPNKFGYQRKLNPFVIAG